MRSLIIILLSFIVIGCELPVSNSVTVQFRDSTYHVYELLSVRDSAIIVGQQLNESIQRAYLLPIKDIHRVYHDNIAEKASWAYKGAALGAGATSLALLVYAAVRGGPFDGQAFGFAAAFLSIPPVIIGGILGYAITSSEIGYDPSDELDRARLRSHAKYTPHGEPIKLRNLRSPKQ